MPMCQGEVQGYACSSTSMTVSCTIDECICPCSVVAVHTSVMVDMNLPPRYGAGWVQVNGPCPSSSEAVEPSIPCCSMHDDMLLAHTYQSQRSPRWQMHGALSGPAKHCSAFAPGPATEYVCRHCTLNEPSANAAMLHPWYRAIEQLSSMQQQLPAPQEPSILQCWPGSQHQQLASDHSHLTACRHH